MMSRENLLIILPAIMALIVFADLAGMPLFSWEVGKTLIGFLAFAMAGIAATGFAPGPGSSHSSLLGSRRLASLNNVFDPQVAASNYSLSRLKDLS